MIPKAHGAFAASFYYLSDSVKDWLMFGDNYLGRLTTTILAG